MYYLGIDIGSLTCDAALIDNQGNLLSTSVIPTGAKNQEAIRRVKEEVLNRANISPDQVSGTVSTGYGRERVEERQKSVTEITCHAQGIKELCNGTRVLIDIGGQDSKVIMLDKEGKVADFVMNDKCAAGTGRFMETMARALQVDIQELGEMDHGATGKVALSNMCTVFAESEVVSLIANDTEINEIVYGLNRSIASRINSMVKRIVKDFNGLSFSMSGGVAHNKGVVRALSEVLGHELTIPDNPDTVGAYGAALIARNQDQ